MICGEDAVLVSIRGMVLRGGEVVASGRSSDSLRGAPSIWRPFELNCEVPELICAQIPCLAKHRPGS